MVGTCSAPDQVASGCARLTPMHVHLVDGTYELFRHHFAVPVAPRPRRAWRSRRRVASSARCSTMLEGGATHVGVATDHVVESFRNELYDRLQDERGDGPGAARAVPGARGRARARSASRCGRWSSSRPTTRSRARRARRRAPTRGSSRSIICTPDKDLGQCVVGDRVVQLDRRKRDDPRRSRRDREVRRAARRRSPTGSRSWATPPTASPGSPGWGAKSAATVLAHYLHLEAIPALAKDWDVDVRGAVKLATTLAEQPRRTPTCSRCSRRCATTPTSARSTTGAGPGPTPTSTRWCERLGAPRHGATGPSGSPSRGADGQDRTTTTHGARRRRGPDRPAARRRSRVITLNRPERRNAMNYDLLAGLYDALDALREDRTCRVIVLTGAGQGLLRRARPRRGRRRCRTLPGIGPAAGRHAGAAVHRRADPAAAQPAAADHRRGQRRGVRRGTRAHARQRHPHRRASRRASTSRSSRSGCPRATSARAGSCPGSSARRARTS